MSNAFSDFYTHFTTNTTNGASGIDADNNSVINSFSPSFIDSHSDSFPSAIRISHTFPDVFTVDEPNCFSFVSTNSVSFIGPNVYANPTNSFSKCESFKYPIAISLGVTDSWSKCTSISFSYASTNRSSDAWTDTISECFTITLSFKSSDTWTDSISECFTITLTFKSSVNAAVLTAYIVTYPCPHGCPNPADIFTHAPADCGANISPISHSFVDAYIDSFPCTIAASYIIPDILTVNATFSFTFLSADCLPYF